MCIYYLFTKELASLPVMFTNYCTAIPYTKADPISCHKICSQKIIDDYSANMIKKSTFRQHTEVWLIRN